MLRDHKRYLYILVGTVVIIAGIAGIALLPNQSPIPSKLTQASVGYTIYYPKDLPTHLQVVTKSIRVTDKAVIIQVSDSNGKKATLTQQRKVNNFDYSALTGDRKVVTSVGMAIVGTHDNVTTASLLTDTTWTLLRTDPGFPTQSADTILSSLQPVPAN